MAIAVGQKVQGTTPYKTYSNPNQSGNIYDMNTDAFGVVKEIRGNMADIDYGQGSGGGTGWVSLDVLRPYMSAPATPQQPQDVQAFLNQTQQNYASMDLPKVQSAQEILAQYKDLLPQGQRAVAPSLASQYKDLSSQYGLDALQQKLTNLNAQEQDLAATNRIAASNERSKRVAANVVQGRLGEQEQTFREDLDFIQRQKSYVVNELNTAQQGIQMVMQFTQQDYTNAAADWDAKFGQALSTINMITGIQQDQKNDIQRGIDNARAALQVQINLIQDGGLDYNSLSPEQRLQMNKLSIQAGYGPDFLSKVRVDPKANVIGQSEMADGRIQLITKNADGSISTQIVGNADSLKVAQINADLAATRAATAQRNAPQQYEPSATEKKNIAATQLENDVRGLLTSQQARAIPYYTENNIIPRLQSAYPELNKAEISKIVYDIRKQLWGS